MRAGYRVRGRGWLWTDLLRVLVIGTFLAWLWPPIEASGYVKYFLLLFGAWQLLATIMFRLDCWVYMVDLGMKRRDLRRLVIGLQEAHLILQEVGSLAANPKATELDAGTRGAIGRRIDEIKDAINLLWVCVYEMNRESGESGYRSVELATLRDSGTWCLQPSPQYRQYLRFTERRKQ